MLSWNSEDVFAEGLVEFYFLDAVFGKEGTLGHLETLREVGGDQDTFEFLELVVRGAEGGGCCDQMAP